MKTLRYLLIICMLAMVAEYSQAQFKTRENKPAFENQFNNTHYEFYSTSTLMGAGSSLPISARNGMKIGANSSDDNTSAGSLWRPRRVGENDEFEDEGEDTGNLPNEPNPIGDGMWVMLLMAMLFCGVKHLRRKQALNS